MILSPIIKVQLCRDAPFAWLMRDKAVNSSRYGIKDIAFFDQRLDNYLQFIKIADANNEDILSTIDVEDWGGVFVHAWLALEQHSEAKLQTLFLLLQTDTQWRELSAALSYQPHAAFMWALPIVQTLVQPQMNHTLLSALNNHRLKVDDAFISHSLQSECAKTLTKALELIGNAKRNTGQDFKNWAAHSEPSVRFYALRADILLGNSARITELGTYISDDNPLIIEALLLLFPLQDSQNAKIIVESINRLDISPRIKLWAMALSGLTECIPSIIEWSADTEYNAIAGEAFACITGVDIEEDDLSPQQETQADDIRNTSSDPWLREYESDLAPPGPDELQQWWGTHRANFTQNRYLMGLSYHPDNFQQILQQGNQLQRRAAAIAIALHEPLAIVENVKCKAR